MGRGVGYIPTPWIYPTSQIYPTSRNHKDGQYASYWNVFLLILVSLTQENSKNAAQFQGPNSSELNIGRSRQNANVPVVKSTNDVNGVTVNFLNFQHWLVNLDLNIGSDPGFLGRGANRRFHKNFRKTPWIKKNWAFNGWGGGSDRHWAALDLPL